MSSGEICINAAYCYFFISIVAHFLRKKVMLALCLSCDRDVSAFDLHINNNKL
jgi:hypothetical protein